jgi:hypothetical protein
LARTRAVECAEPDTGWIEREFLGHFAGVALAPAPELALAAAAVAEAMGLTRDGAGATGAAVPGHASDTGSAHDPFSAAGRWRQKGLE